MAVKLNSTGGGSVTLDTPSTASNYTVTLPAANTTLADTSSTQTLTNKTLTAAGSNSVEATSGPTSTQLAGQRNKIINGAMMIDQRNAGAAVTPANGQYLTDRWVYSAYQASKITAQQSTVSPAGFTNSLLITSTSAYTVGASEYFILQQRIEGFNVSDLGWGATGAQSVNLSFWVRSSLTGAFGGSLNNNGLARSYPFSFTINAANTWEQKTVTITGDTAGTWLTNNGIGLYVSFNLGSGSTFSTTAGAWAAGSYTAPTGATSVVGTNGATFYITGVQLEKGATATPFENRLYGTELALCQRYYNQIPSATLSGATFYNGPNIAFVNINLPVTPRATPSVSYTNTLYVLGNATSIAVSGTPASITLNSPAYVQFTVTATGIVANTTYWFYTSSGTLVISAEL